VSVDYGANEIPYTSFNILIIGSLQRLRHEILLAEGYIIGISLAFRCCCSRINGKGVALV
jgi:hypothetical protein